MVAGGFYPHAGKCHAAQATARSRRRPGKSAQPIVKSPTMTPPCRINAENAAAATAAVVTGTTADGPPVCLYNAAMADTVACSICGRLIELQKSFVVRIDVFADPSMPELSSKELNEMDFDETLKDLMDEMKDMSAEDL